MREKYLVTVVSFYKTFYSGLCTTLDNYCADWDRYGFNGTREHFVLIQNSWESSELYVWRDRII